jgi:hypothetical protein
MMLAPSADKLQPLPPDVQPAVSQSMQRTASPADLQTIQNVQAAEQSSASVQQNGSVPAIPYVPSSASNSVALWFALIIAVIVAGGAVWFWRSF